MPPPPLPAAAAAPTAVTAAAAAADDDTPQHPIVAVARRQEGPALEFDLVREELAAEVVTIGVGGPAGVPDSPSSAGLKRRRPAMTMAVTGAGDMETQTCGPFRRVRQPVWGSCD